MEFATPPHNVSHPPPPPPSVPPGWTTCFNEQYQTWFFVNLQTQQSQWTPPTQSVSPQPPIINEPRQETDEEMARRLQAEFEREASGPVASSPFQEGHAGSSPYHQSNGAYAHSSTGEYSSSFAAGQPWGQAPPPHQPQPQPQQQHHQQQHQDKDTFSKIFDKYGHKIPMAGTLGAAAGLSGSHSAPTSRPSSPYEGSSYHPHSDANGHLAPPGQDDKKKKRSSWAAGAGGAAVGAAATYGAGKLKDKFLYGSSSGSGIGGDGKDKKKKKKKKGSSWSGGGGGGGKWDGLGGGDEGDGGGDGGGDDWGFGGGDDGGGLGEALGSLVM